MDTASLIRFLDDPFAATDWVRACRLENRDLAHRNLLGMTRAGIPLDLLATICDQLQDELPRCSDPDMALNNLERFVVAQRNPLGLASLFERDLDALPTLLQILSTSQHLSDLLVRDPESFDLLRMTDGQPVDRDVLAREIAAEVLATQDERVAAAILRRYKHREVLRIAFGDIVRKQRFDLVTKQLSYLAEVITDAAVQFARRQLEQQRGTPRLPDGRAARFVVLALGKLGGFELNYSSDIDLVCLHEGDGKTDGERSLTNREFFERLVRAIIKLLTEATELGAAYRVDLRLRPNGEQSPTVIGVEEALRYYDVSGRTWERQAYVKARPIAGDLELGHEFLRQLEPWIYRRYLSRADITGIRALKRRIEQRARRDEHDDRNLKTGHGGIRDIEFVIQFLQLLNGGDLPQVRTGNTLQALAGLEEAGCLTGQERGLLEENYEFLRKVEHRLQIMFDLRTHTLPDNDRELRRLAIRTGYRDDGPVPALDQFKADLKKRTDLNRKILDHLLHDAFEDDAATEPVTDLILDPDPDPEVVRETLGRYGFRDLAAANQNLMSLAVEPIRFLSTRRCRHFLASIAPRLLETIAASPDPDATLVSLSKVSDSLGGKGVLWELFSFNPPSLRLYVQLCGCSPYLSSILMSNPGMIDELMDSLVLDKLPTLESLEASLAELSRGAEDMDPILHSFKNANHLRVGVRDILGKEDLRDLHRALSDIAEACLRQIARQEFERLAEKFGEPTLHGGERDGQPCELILLAMGKLGGREPNYHSDLDVIFLYEGEGQTRIKRGQRGTPTTNQHFFGQLAQRIIKVITQLGPMGRLYELDARLRPTGRSGALAISLSEFRRYFFEGHGQLWERQALCKARPVFGSPEACAATTHIVREIITSHDWQPSDAATIRQMRQRLEETASPVNLKRGPGGTLDIEFLVQLLQLQNARRNPTVLLPGTLDALDVLYRGGHLSDDDHRALTESYRFLRSVETSLRLMNTTARHDLPHDETELKRLANLLGGTNGTAIQDKCRALMADNRQRFERLCS